MKYIPFERKIFEKQGEHHLVQVFDRGERRDLRFGNHIIQSSYIAAAPDILQLDYTRAMLAGLVFCPTPSRILHIGLGGGTLPRFIHRHFPDVHQRVVELCPEVIEAAFRFFDLPNTYRLDVSVGNGAAYLRTDHRLYTAIFLDAFHADGASEDIQNRETIQAAQARLAPGGWLFCNAWGSHVESLRELRAHLRQLFTTLYSVSVRAESNVIFFGSVDGQSPSPRALMERADRLSRDLPFDFTSYVSRIRPVADLVQAAARR